MRLPQGLVPCTCRGLALGLCTLSKRTNYIVLITCLEQDGETNLRGLLQGVAAQGTHVTVTRVVRSPQEKTVVWAG